MNRLLKILLMATVVLCWGTAKGQIAGLKTNVLNWATGTVNFAGEIAVTPKMTLNVAAASNIPGLIYFGDKAKNRKLWNWTVQPEVRFWHNEAFNRGFMGVHLVTGAYDAGGIKLPLGLFPDLANNRFEGWMAGVGVSYGWQWYLTPHFNLEATLGFGYLYLQYNRFGGPEGSASQVMNQKDATHHYFGPTKLGVSISYLFGSKK